MSLTLKTLVSRSPSVLEVETLEVRRETDTEIIYQLPDETRAPKDFVTVSVRKKTLAKNLNRNHSQQIVITVPWFTTDGDGVSTLGGYENATINITSSAAAPALVRSQTTQMLSSLFELADATSIPVASSDVDDFINSRRL